MILSLQLLSRLIELLPHNHHPVRVLFASTHSRSLGLSSTCQEYSPPRTAVPRSDHPERSAPATGRAVGRSGSGGGAPRHRVVEFAGPPERADAAPRHQRDLEHTLSCLPGKTL
jgi:hypothetical protein